MSPTVFNFQLNMHSLELKNCSQIVRTKELKDTHSKCAKILSFIYNIGKLSLKRFLHCTQR